MTVARLILSWVLWLIGIAVGAAFFAAAMSVGAQSMDGLLAASWVIAFCWLGEKVKR
jgi:hypothetical protein